MAKSGKRGFSFHPGEAVRGFLTEYAYLVTLGAIIAVMAGSALYTKHLHEQPGIQAAAPAPEIAETPAPTPMPTILPLSTPERTASLTGAIWPLTSQTVLTGYDKAPVFWPSLACFQPHPAVDIAGTDGEDVLCMRDGVVLRAVRDDLWGWRVEVEQTDGLVCAYAGLALSFVEAGQTVARGQPLGTLLDAPPCEADAGPHLHLSLSKDGRPLDPLPFLPEKPKLPG